MGKRPNRLKNKFATELFRDFFEQEFDYFFLSETVLKTFEEIKDGIDLSTSKSLFSIVEDALSKNNAELRDKILECFQAVIPSEEDNAEFVIRLKLISLALAIGERDDDLIPSLLKILENHFRENARIDYIAQMVMKCNLTKAKHYLVPIIEGLLSPLDLKELLGDRCESRELAMLLLSIREGRQLLLSLVRDTEMEEYDSLRILLLNQIIEDPSFNSLEYPGYLEFLLKWYLEYGSKTFAVFPSGAISLLAEAIACWNVRAVEGLLKVDGRCSAERIFRKMKFSIKLLRKLSLSSDGVSYLPVLLYKRVGSFSKHQLDEVAQVLLRENSRGELNGSLIELFTAIPEVEKRETILESVQTTIADILQHGAKAEQECALENLLELARLFEGCDTAVSDSKHSRNWQDRLSQTYALFCNLRRAKLDSLMLLRPTHSTVTSTDLPWWFTPAMHNAYTKLVTELWSGVNQLQVILVRYV